MKIDDLARAALTHPGGFTFRATDYPANHAPGSQGVWPVKTFIPCEPALAPDPYGQRMAEFAWLHLTAPGPTGGEHHEDEADHDGPCAIPNCFVCARQR